MKVFSLIILPGSVDLLCSGQDIDMEAHARECRLIHEQGCQNGAVRWCFFATSSLSKPEALRRAQQWYDACHHPDWPGFVH